VTAFFDEDVTGWHGVHQAFQIREFAAEGLLLTAVNLTPTMLAGILPAYGRELGALMADYNRIVTAGPLVTDTATGRVRNVPGVGPQVFYALADRDAARVVRGVELTAEALFAAGARRVLLPFDGAPEVRSPGELRRLLTRPVPRRSLQLYSIHLMGTARMSEDPGAAWSAASGSSTGSPGFSSPTRAYSPARSVSIRWRRSSPWPCATRGGWSSRGLAPNLVTARRRPGYPARRSNPRRSCWHWGRGTRWSSRWRTGTADRSRRGARWGSAARRCRGR